MITGSELGLGINSVSLIELDILRIQQVRKSLRCVLKIKKTAAFSLLDPRIIISVSVKDDPLMLSVGLLDELMQALFKILSSLQLVRKLHEYLSYSSVDDCICAGQRYI